MMTQDKINTLQLFSQPSRERLSAQIAAQIKKLIFSKKLKVGQKLPTERELAETLGVSRVVVREALRSLEQAGFIEIRPGHTGGSFVSNEAYKPLFNTIADLFQDGDLTLQHFYEVRRSIECLSIQQAIQHITEQNIQALREINARMVGDIQNNTQFHFNNRDFHVKISEISGNPLIKLMVGALLNILIIIYPNPTQSADFIGATYKRHGRIIDAMEQKKGNLCEKLIVEDVELTKKMLD